MSHPMRPVGTLGDPEDPPELAEPVLVHPSDPVLQDPAQTYPRPRHRIRQSVRGHLRGLAGLPSHLYPHH